MGRNIGIVLAGGIGRRFGGGKPKQDFGKRTVYCSCGAENEIPKLIRPGMTFYCSECGAELEI